MFGKNKKSAKGKKSGNILGRLKPNKAAASSEAAVSAEETQFDPMAVQVAAISEEDKIDANFGDFLIGLEKEITEEMVAADGAVVTERIDPGLSVPEEIALDDVPVEPTEAVAPAVENLELAHVQDVLDAVIAVEEHEDSLDVVEDGLAPTLEVEPIAIVSAEHPNDGDPVPALVDTSASETALKSDKEIANSWQGNADVKESLNLLFGPVDDNAAPMEPDAPGEILPVVAPKPELKAIFRSDGQEVNVGRIGRFVHERKQVNADALDAAYRMQEVTGRPIGQILVANGFLTDKQRVEAILSVEESRISQEQVSRSRIPVALLEQYSIIISAEHDETIFVASPHPEAIIEPIIAEYYSEKKIEFVSYDPSAMGRFIATMRRSASVEDIRETKETMLDRIVYKALENNASDIHVEPLAECYVVQFRIDGSTRIVHAGALDEYHTVIAQVKDKSTIDLAEKRKSQDGSYQIEYNGKMIDLRVSTLPVQTGEKVTIRVLDSDRVHPNLETLGISQVNKWRRGFKQRAGLCVIAGATGSGKTTTLNSSLRELDRFGRKIYTIEDPVEYRVPFVSQVSTNLSVGLDFAAAIKAFMRHDPDVIVLGEVRDAETARNAIKAADTGHLVLMTLHTSSIMSTINRLKDLGIDPREIRYMLRAILVQHLIPTFCTNCHGVDSHNCRVCKGSRYVGRTVASECEYFENVKDVDKLLNSRNGDIADDERPWVSMAEDAVRQMRQGVTDVTGLEMTFGTEIYPFLTEEELKLCSNL